MLERIEYADLVEIAVDDPPPYGTAGQKAAETAVKVVAAILSLLSPVGGLSDNMNDVGVTLRTVSGELTLLHRSELTIDAWRSLLAPAIARSTSSAWQRRG